MTPDEQKGERVELIERARDLLKPEHSYWAQHDREADPTGAALEAIACLLLADRLPTQPRNPGS